MKGRGQQALTTLLDFGKVLSTSVATAKSSVLAKLQGASEDEVSEEEVLSTNAAIIFRPAEPNGDGACEVMFLRQDDERTVLTTRDVRWQISVEVGETVVRAFGENAAVLRLKPNGDVVIETAGTIYNGSDAATDAPALASRVKALETAILTHNHPTAPVGPVSVPVFVPAYTPQTFDSARVKIDS